MSRVEHQSLPWRIFGRLLRPYAFAVSLATSVLCYSIAAGVALGQLLNGGPGRVVAAWGGLAVVLLWWGWWARSERFMRWGLFWTTGVWAAATSIMVLDVGYSPVSAMLAGCWVIASGGAWLLEVTDSRRRTSDGGVS